MSFYNGQRVRCTKDWIISTGRIVTVKGLSYIINGSMTISCGCTVYDLGQRFSQKDLIVKSSMGFNCKHKTQFSSGDVIWCFESYFEAVHEDSERDKLSSEVELIRLLAHKQITKETYLKIYDMINSSDIEMFKLGKMIIENDS